MLAFKILSHHCFEIYDWSSTTLVAHWAAREREELFLLYNTIALNFSLSILASPISFLGSLLFCTSMRLTLQFPHKVRTCGICRRYVNRIVLPPSARSRDHVQEQVLRNEEFPPFCFSPPLWHTCRYSNSSINYLTKKFGFGYLTLQANKTAMLMNLWLLHILDHVLISRTFYKIVHSFLWHIYIKFYSIQLYLYYI